MLKFLIYIFLSLLLVSPDETEKKCRDRSRPISTENRDFYELVDAILHQNLTLQCHYCNENDDSQPKNWYKIDKVGLGEAREVQLSMENEMELNRIWINTDHSLNINNFSETDTGLYYCREFEQPEIDEKYNYLVDLVFERNVTELESGNLTDWAKYHEEHFTPINKLFAESEGKEFVHLREHLKVSLEAISHWDPWGMCEVCGRANGEGVRKKRGRCRIKLTRTSRENSTSNPDELFFLNANEVSCRSMKLGKMFPGMSNLTKIVPDFIQQEKCEGTCNPDAEGVNKGWKVGKTKGFKYRKTFVLPEKSHLTLVCPESTLENTVTWRKRGKALVPGDSGNPHLVVDTFNTLYLLDVTESEEGNYTCQVDDIRMQQVTVHVFSKSRLLTQELVRHLNYLGFVLSLTIPCYCAGLIVTWSRRRNFKSYEELLKENPEEDEFEGLL
nr:uncharacterized protein LOC111511428 [Leptinotarsa decemlineata]